MNSQFIDEPKKTKAAVMMALISLDERLLVLYRKKWENEGTPFILPGGGVKEGESFYIAMKREAIEEIGFCPAELDGASHIEFPTKWTDNMRVYTVVIPKKSDEVIIRLDPRKFQDVKLWIPLYNPFVVSGISYCMMPGLATFLEKYYSIDREANLELIKRKGESWQKR